MSWLPKQKVIVPVDFSEQSFAAVETALSLVDDASHIYVVHILEPLVDYEAGLVWNGITDDERRERSSAAIREKLADARFQGMHVVTDFGDPGSQVAEYADQIKADLVVVPSHGRTGLTRILIGSVAERIVRLAHCPVLVLKSPAKT